MDTDLLKRAMWLQILESINKRAKAIEESEDLREMAEQYDDLAKYLYKMAARMENIDADE
jgi:hypothetical protein